MNYNNFNNQQNMGMMNNYNMNANPNNGPYPNMNRQYSHSNNLDGVNLDRNQYNRTPPIISGNQQYNMNQNNMGMNNLGIELQGGLYKNDSSSQQMLNVGQNIINMNMQQQINLNNKADVNNLFSHPNEDSYNRQYNLTDQNDFRGKNRYQGMKSGDEYGKRKKWTPFDIKDYKDLSKTHNYTVGGLGANMNEEWMLKKKKADKAKEYSDVIKDMNSDKIANQPYKKPIASKTTSNRDKAMEFAKHVPKPSKRSDSGMIKQITETDNNPKLDSEIRMLETGLEELELQHQYYQNRINNNVK